MAKESQHKVSQLLLCPQKTNRLAPPIFKETCPSPQILCPFPLIGILRCFPTTATVVETTTSQSSPRRH